MHTTHTSKHNKAVWMNFACTLQLERESHMNTCSFIPVRCVSGCTICNLIRLIIIRERVVSSLVLYSFYFVHGRYFRWEMFGIKKRRYHHLEKHAYSFYLYGCLGIYGKSQFMMTIIMVYCCSGVGRYSLVPCLKRMKRMMMMIMLFCCNSGIGLFVYVEALSLLAFYSYHSAHSR